MNNKERLVQMATELIEMVWENLLWDGMEAVLYDDGETWTRQASSFGEDEDKIIYKINLDTWYWADSFTVTKNDDGEIVKDESMREEFFDTMINEVIENLEREIYKRGE